jgi:nucleoside-diphosphate-sugar epimerase
MINKYGLINGVKAMVMNFWIGKKILVTGGAGLIGSHLVEALVRHGAAVSVVDNLKRGPKGY